MQARFTDNGEISSRYLSDIRQVLLDFMREIGVAYPRVTYDAAFAQSCCDVALLKGFRSEIVQSSEFQLALQGAVAIATTTYAHLENVATRQWICLYTTW